MPLSALVPVQGGGTGATNPEDAQANLNILPLVKLAKSLLAIGMNQQSFAISEKPNSSLSSVAITTTGVNFVTYEATKCAFDGRYIVGGINDSLDGKINYYDTYKRTYHQANLPQSVKNSISVTSVNCWIEFKGNGCYDGKYLYFSGASIECANIDGISALNFIRKNSYTSFDDAAGYELFNICALFNSIGVSNVDIITSGTSLGNSTFDGQYVYYIGYISNYGALNKEFVIRYDTNKAFTDAGAWQIFDLSTLPGYVFSGAYIIDVIIAGACFYAVMDYKAIYKYDLAGTFTDAGAWTFTSFTSLGLTSTSGGQLIFDGSYIYFLNRYDSYVVRYDIAASFTAGASYAEYDLSLVDANYQYSNGGFFDGKYLWIVPAISTLHPQGFKFDVTAVFNDLASYSPIPYSKFYGTAGIFNTTLLFDGNNAYIFTSKFDSQKTEYVTILETPQRTSFPFAH